MSSLWLGPSSRTGKLIVHVLVAVALYAGAIFGLSVLPGYGTVGHVLSQVHWPWIVASAAGVAVAFAGYVLAWRGIARAGFLDITLVMCLWACGAPLAVAIAGTATYRFFSPFAPMPLCFAALPPLRAIGGERAAPSDEPAVQPSP